MEVNTTIIEGCFLITPKVFQDERGHFFESFNLDVFEKATGEKPVFVQDNESYSKKGVLRGLHFQKGKDAQAKLVRVLDGKILDVVVDIRPKSRTYGKVVRTILSSDNRNQLFIPRGCAHGFVALTNASFFYKCDNFYNKTSESGIRYNDPHLNIDWILDDSQLIISSRDAALPLWNQLVAN